MLGTELGPPVPPRRADSAVVRAVQKSALLSNFSPCLRACSKVISRRAASAASAQLQHIPPPSALGSRCGKGGSRRPRPVPRTPVPGWETPPKAGEQRAVGKRGQAPQWSGNLGLCVAGSGPSPHPAQPLGARAVGTRHLPARDRRPPGRSSRAGPCAAPSGVSAEPG